MLTPSIESFPARPGVYWMKDAKGEVLYVGKARHLRNRVKAYFRKEALQRYQIDFLMRRTADIEYLVTDNEKEALLLENNLIKKYRPRYNIHCKDDKSYASLKLNIGHPFPGFFVTRNIVKDGSSYFGPYASASALRQTLDWLTKHFKLRTCSDHELANRSRPCLEYSLGRCSAPCVGKVSKEGYAQQMEEAKLFLQGKKKELSKVLKARMQKASATQAYEEAARLRDLIRHIEETLKGQKVASHQEKNYDAIGMAQDRAKTVIFVLLVRAGNLIDRRHFIFVRSLEEPAEILVHFLLQYYGKGSSLDIGQLQVVQCQDLTPLVFLPIALNNSTQLQEILATQLRVPKRGEKAKLVAMATQNASEFLTKALDRTEAIIAHLQRKLLLPLQPRIIECADISNFQGKAAVGSLVCFENGEPRKDRYRRFKIRLSETPNDYAMMQEMLSRRFKRALTITTEEEKRKWQLPDLLLVDGGKGQLAVAKKVLGDLGLHNLALAAIAKARKGPSTSSRLRQGYGGQAGRSGCDKVYIPRRVNPVSLAPRSQELLYLMRLRDEAHRFGLAYHRKLRLTKF